MNEHNDWKELLKKANEDLKPHNYRLSVSDREEKGFFNCVIYKGRKKVETYAENYYEKELEELINGAWYYVKSELCTDETPMELTEVQAAMKKKIDVINAFNKAHGNNVYYQSYGDRYYCTYDIFDDYDELSKEAIDKVYAEVVSSVSEILESAAIAEGIVSEKVKEIAKSIIDEYYKDSEVCIGEFLAWKEPKGITFEEAFQVYVLCMKTIEHDKFYTIKEEEIITL